MNVLCGALHGKPMLLLSSNITKKEKLGDEWPESIFHRVGSQSVSYLLSVQCEVLSRVS